MRGRAGERLVGDRLERHDAAAAVAAVGGDQHLGLRVVDPVAQRLGAEAAEDDGVHRADAGAGQHARSAAREPSACRSRRGRPCRTPSPFRHVGEPVHLAVQVASRSACGGRPARPPRSIAALLRRAVFTWRSRQLTQALSCPPTNHLACGGSHSSTRVPGLGTTRVRSAPRPERLGVLLGALVDRRSRTFACSRNGGRRLEDTVFVQQRIDVALRLDRGARGFGHRSSFDVRRPPTSDCGYKVPVYVRKCRLATGG